MDVGTNDATTVVTFSRVSLAFLLGGSWKSSISDSESVAQHLHSLHQYSPKQDLFKYI